MPVQDPACSRANFACAQEGDDMSETPFMQLYVSDFIGDTLALSTEQVGAYLLALMAMWNAGGELPDDDRKLARITRLSPKKWLAARPDIEPFFTVSDGVWVNERLTKELQKARSKSESRASAGAKGGYAKALKTNNQDLANASDLLCHSSEPEPYIYSEPKGSESYVALSDPVPASKPKDETPRMALDAYNEAAASVGWALAQRMSKSRESSLKARINEAGGLDGWKMAMDKAKASSFLRGETGSDRNWRPNLDFFLQAKSFTKLMEGGYDDRQGTAKPAQSNRVSPSEENILRAFAFAGEAATGRGSEERLSIAYDADADDGRDYSYGSGH